MHSTTRDPQRTRIASAALTVLAAATVSLGGASIASADTTVAVNHGDITFITVGGLFDGGTGVDRLDPVSRQRSRVTSFGVSESGKAGDVVADTRGDLYVWGWENVVSKINHVTGEHTDVFHSSTAIHDIAIDNDGGLLLLTSDNAGYTLQRVTSTSHATTISRDGLLGRGSGEQGLQALSDGRLVVGTDHGLVEIDRKTGAQKRITTFSTPSWTMDSDGTVYFVSTAQGELPWVKKFAYNDPDHVSNVSTWSRYAYASDMTVDSDHTLVLLDNAPDDDDGYGGGHKHVDRLNPTNGRANTLITVGFYEATGLAIAGVSLHPTPTPAPTTTPDFYNGQQDQTINAAAYDGVLANDTDPQGKKLSVTDPGVLPTVHGQVDLHADGSFHYTPKPGYSGSDSFLYAATNGSLQSHAERVSLDVEAKHQSPTAKSDSYQVKAGAKFSAPAPGVLANDVSPDHLKLQALLVSQPKHGKLTLSGNGSFTYTPTAGYKGQDQLSYQDYDDSGIDGFSTPVSVTLNVK